MNHETKIAVVEMGANHPGEVDFLCRIARPDYGLITNIGKAHLEGFGGYEGVIRTKTELYRYLQSNHGTIFLNQDDEILMEQAKNQSAISYGTADSSLSFQSITADPFVRIEILFKDRTSQSVSSKLYGRYNVSNILAAACIGQYFQVDHTLIKDAIEHYEPSNNRSQVVRTSANLLIMDAYNANPVSMKEALETFAGTSYSAKTLILGDMLELGSESDAEHETILRLVEQMQFQAVYLVGPVFTRLNRKLEFLCFQDADLARIWFEHHPVKDSTILLKGSRGIKLEKIAVLL
jgi:UDP-N-acetylmuramoyl-tripeptide--D-alanyl-D-alanine ligase